MQRKTQNGILGYFQAGLPDVWIENGYEPMNRDQHILEELFGTFNFSYNLSNNRIRYDVKKNGNQK